MDTTSDATNKGKSAHPGKNQQHHQQQQQQHPNNGELKSIATGLHVGDVVDIGINLAHKSFQRDLVHIIDRAVLAGVTRMIITGTCVASSEKSHRLTQTHKDNGCALYSTAGVHPHDAKTCNESTIASIERLASRPEVVAIGETGLDFNRNFSTPEDQIKWFELQVELACRLGKPLFLHERDAHSKFVEILSKFKGRLPPVVVHCFTGNEQELKTYVSMGFYIGLTGFICKAAGSHVLELSRIIPHDRLLIETDAPFMLPRDQRVRIFGQRNEPCTLPLIAEAIAQVVKVPPQRVASQTTMNALKFFRIR